MRVTNSFAVTDCGPTTGFGVSFLAAALLKIEAVTDTGRDTLLVDGLFALAITEFDKG